MRSILKISHLAENSSVGKSFPSHSAIRDAEIRLELNMGRKCKIILNCFLVGTITDRLCTQQISKTIPWFRLWFRPTRAIARTRPCTSRPVWSSTRGRRLRRPTSTPSAIRCTSIPAPTTLRWRHPAGPGTYSVQHPNTDVLWTEHR